jgi:hypothetical protein
MKKFLPPILALAIFGCGENEKFSIDCLPSNLRNGVIAFYPFNNGSLMDESSH